MSPSSMSSPTLASSDDPLVERSGSPLILLSSLPIPIADCTMSSRWAKMSSRSVGVAAGPAFDWVCLRDADRARRVRKLWVGRRTPMSCSSVG
jgi:hypothetical protein